jgi:Rod binding domain-containing protein
MNTVANLTSPVLSGAAAPESADVKKIKKAASDFESMLLAKWWSSMKQSGLSDDDSSDPGHETLDEMGIQAMSTAVANGGGLGIAAMLVKSLLSKAQEAATKTPIAAPASISNKKI